MTTRKKPGREFPNPEAAGAQRGDWREGTALGSESCRQQEGARGQGSELLSGVKGNVSSIESDLKSDAGVCENQRGHHRSSCEGESFSELSFKQTCA